MYKPLIAALLSLFIASTVSAVESNTTTYTFSYSDKRTISEVKLNAKHAGQEILHGVVTDVLFNSHLAIAAILEDPAMQLQVADKHTKVELAKK